MLETQPTTRTQRRHGNDEPPRKSKRLVSVRNTAERLDVSPKTVRRLIRDGASQDDGASV